MKQKEGLFYYPTRKEILDTYCEKKEVQKDYRIKDTLDNLYSQNLIDESENINTEKLNIFDNEIPYPMNQIIFTNPKIKINELEKKILFYDGLQKLKSKNYDIDNLQNTDKLIELILNERDEDKIKKYLDIYESKEFDEILLYSKKVLRNCGIENFTKKELLQNNITLDKIIDSVQEAYSNDKHNLLTLKYKTPNNQYIKQSIVENECGVSLYNFRKDQITYNGPYNDLVVGKVPSRRKHKKKNQASLFYIPLTKKENDKELNCYYWRKFYGFSTSEFNQFFPVIERKEEKRKNSSFFLNSTVSAIYTKLIRDLEDKRYSIKISPIIYPSKSLVKKIDKLRYQSLMYDSLKDTYRPLNKTEMEIYATKEMLKDRKNMIVTGF